jgi:8-oxo-dGTP pyrophosphatase MutT (NUDIX family)
VTDEVADHVTEGTREAARVLLLDPGGRILLLRGADPTDASAGSWWFTPGGGLEGAEAPEDAARREVREETGAILGELGGPVWERTSAFDFAGTHYHQHELYFVARVEPFEVSPDARTELEVRALTGARWWSLPELETTAETVFPENLADLLRRALGG